MFFSSYNILVPNDSWCIISLGRLIRVDLIKWVSNVRPPVRTSTKSFFDTNTDTDRQTDTVYTHTQTTLCSTTVTLGRISCTACSLIIFMYFYYAVMLELQRYHIIAHQFKKYMSMCVDTSTGMLRYDTIHLRAHKSWRNGQLSLLYSSGT